MSFKKFMKRKTKKEKKLTKDQRNAILLFLAADRYHKAIRKEQEKKDEEWLLNMIEEIVFNKIGAKQ